MRLTKDIPAEILCSVFLLTLLITAALTGKGDGDENVNRASGSDGVLSVGVGPLLADDGLLAIDRWRGFAYRSNVRSATGMDADVEDGPANDAQPPTIQPPSNGVDAGAYPSEMIAAICGQGFDWNCETALAVSWQEMGQKYNPGAWNEITVWIGDAESHASGCFQLLLPFHAGLFDGDPFDCAVNARAAYRLWTTNGWEPW